MKIKIFALHLSSLICVAALNAVTITSFGNSTAPTFTVINGGDANAFGSTPGASSLTITGTEGNILSGDVAPFVDASAEVGAALDMFITASSVSSAPASAFSIELFDGDFDSIIYENGSWSDLSGGTATLTLAGSNASFDASNIIGFDLIGGGLGSSSVDAVLTGLFIGAVPEPSSYAALAGLMALGYVMVRRRQA